MKCGLEFVHYHKIPATVEAMDAERDADSVQAIRNGMGQGHKREGIVLRPLIEVRTNNGARVCAKHKRAEFSERASTPEVDPARREILEEAAAIASEWVTPMRLVHVLDKLPDATDMKATPEVIKAMLEDVLRESAGEIVDSKEARKAIAHLTMKLFKEKIMSVA